MTHERVDVKKGEKLISQTDKRPRTIKEVVAILEEHGFKEITKDEVKVKSKINVQ